MYKVTVIGLGAMGAAIAAVLVEQNYEVTVWNRTPARADSLIRKGAVLASSVASAIAASPITIVCVADYQVSTSLLDQEPVKSALAGRVLIQLSTGSPQQARDLEAWAVGLGATYLDGAIVASPSQMGSVGATVFASGSMNAWGKSESLLQKLAGNVSYHGEQVSAAASVDLAFLAYLFASYLGFFHAARILESDDLSVEDFGTMIAQVSPVIGEVMKYQGAVIQNNSYSQPLSSLQMSMTSIELLTLQARESGINNEFPRFAENLFQRALNAGYGGEEVAALVKVLR
ncbi:3-hydroxyisobutyrate dehydrogenase-like beta-hydroxyacid dehydrogenase [Paenibacillus turicensis]|uniref:3-hydroxyisobutyrate dehydrogenase-like beta-hydroxyacid dehydrogenase n=1 Tax=Paenibacillus turicensis TaxID=160487 RepID=A0ABS4FLM1_9BACL|nr:NAD(P)-binding domain-containing protein [Paenibacillus turicensis]MBP1903489.1 3-hydroxyisobutyrate dehydrogenase-like beta-hydroxyacid dehydrogenase [Paenibacillus turicensis]